jgi:hypothetical protein
MGSTGRPSRSSTYRCRTRLPRASNGSPPTAAGQDRSGGISKCQYYEFLALDRTLTGKQRAELRSLSTCTEITATRFVNQAT